MTDEEIGRLALEDGRAFVALQAMCERWQNRAAHGTPERKQADADMRAADDRRRATAKALRTAVINRLADGPES